MPDDIRTQQIEKRIDREVAGGMLPVPTGGAFNLAPRDMGQAMEFGKLMAVSGGCVRPAFRNNPGMCLAISLQAWRDGGDPFAYANHAYIVNDQLAFEAKLVHAIVNTRAPTVGRLRTTYSGDGAKRRCKVIGYLRGEDEPFEYESPEIGTIKVQNSPLWKSDPDQQLHYFSIRSWARRHVPEVLLGIYTPEEIQGEIIDMTPTHGGVQEATPAAAEPIPWEVCDAEGEVYKFGRSNSAIEACRKILIASAADPEKLATAWENNAAFILSLGQEGLEPEAQGIERLYAELMPQPQPEIGQPGQTPAGTAAVSAEGREEATPGTPPAADADDLPYEGNPLADGRQGKEAAAIAETSDTGDVPIHPPSEGQPVVSDQHAEANAGPRQSPRQPSADPFWQRPSLTILAPPVRGGGSLSKLDWKSWPALLGPRIRQVWTIELLNRLYQDNADNLGLYEAAVGSRGRSEMDALFDDARMELAPQD